MVKLSARHVRRPRLTRALSATPVGLMEAGGGYGKSSLAAEFGDVLGVPTVYVLLHPGDDGPDVLVARLGTALARAGLSDAAARVRSVPTAVAAIDELVSLLADRSDPLLLVVDNIRYAGSCGPLLTRLVAELPEPHRLLLVGRQLAADAAALRTAANVTRLDAGDLAFTTDEVAALVGAHGVTVSPTHAARLERMASGWAAALALIAPHLARAADPIKAIGVLEGQPGALEHLVRAALGGLAAVERDALAQAAHLPVLQTAIVHDATGVAGLIDRAVEAGLPLTIMADGALAIPDPVRDLLTNNRPLAGDTARRAAAAYLASGHSLAAVTALLAADLHTDAAMLVSGLAPRQVDRIDCRDLEYVVAQLPATVVDAHPGVLLRLARACELAGRSHTRQAALRRTALAVERAEQPALAREMDAEFAMELARAGHHHAAIALAAQLLRDAGDSEQATRARAAETNAHVLAAPTKPHDLSRAAQHLTDAARAWHRLGELGRVAAVLADHGESVDVARGDYPGALARYDEALTLVGGLNHLRAGILVRRARALVDCGRYFEAEAGLREAHDLAEVHADRRLVAAVALTRAIAASQTGDAPAAVAHLQHGERHLDDWFDTAEGVTFLTEAAQLLDRVGESPSAWAYLERSSARRAEDPLAVDLTEGALHARTGDPERAEAILTAAVAGSLLPRDRWRAQLLRAAAAQRAGMASAGVLAAQAFEDAAGLGDPALPLTREHSITEGLLALAAAEGSPAAAALANRDLPWAIRVFGAFAVTRGGQPLAVPPGRAAQLVQFLVVRGGRAHLDEVSDTLWPDEDSLRGRSRIRNVLNRLRAACGMLVVRDGELLSLAAGARVDLALFHAEAHDALANPAGPRALALARSAAARYRGELLPDDRYSQWTIGPRDRARTRLLALLELLVAAAEDRGDVDEALRLLDRAIDVDAESDDRYLHAAKLLWAQGRRGDARRMLAHAQRVAHDLGLPPPPTLADLAEAGSRDVPLS